MWNQRDSVARPVKAGEGKSGRPAVVREEDGRLFRVWSPCLVLPLPGFKLSGFRPGRRFGWAVSRGQ